MDIPKEQAWQNIVNVLKQFRGLTIDEGAILQQSIGVVQSIIEKAGRNEQINKLE